MKFWLDRTFEQYDMEEKCLNIQPIQTATFRMSISLHAQMCSDEKWVVCNPTGSGQIAVLDQQTFTLLTRFCEPVTVSEVTQHMPEEPLDTIERATALFHYLGLLQDVYSHQFLQNKLSPKILSVWLHITNACNLRCSYCYLQKSSERMSNPTAFQAVDSIFRSAVKHSYQHILLKYAGGEASLRSTNVLAIHDYASSVASRHALKMSAYLMSNGVVLPKRLIDSLLTRNIGVMISLDGIGTNHDCQRPLINGQGSFKYVDRTIMQLLACGLVPHINVTVSQRNLAGLPSLIEYILEREMPFTLSYYRDNECSTHSFDLQFTDAQMISAMRTVFAVIEQRLPEQCLVDSLIDKARMTTPHQRTCGIGQNYLVIDQHGRIAKCHADITSIVTTIGAEDPLQAIQDDRQGVQGVSVDEKEGCRTCQWRYWCTGGCPLLTYRVTGRSDVKSPYCNVYKTLFPEVLRLEALRLLKYTQPITL
jgi:uncharacterized protein